MAATTSGQELVISLRAQHALPLEPVIEVSDIDVVLQRASKEEILHGDDAEGTASLTTTLGSSLVNFFCICRDETGATEEEMRLLWEEQEALHGDSLRVPNLAPMDCGLPK